MKNHLFMALYQTDWFTQSENGKYCHCCTQGEEAKIFVEASGAIQRRSVRSGTRGWPMGRQLETGTTPLPSSWSLSLLRSGGARSHYSFYLWRRASAHWMQTSILVSGELPESASFFDNGKPKASFQLVSTLLSPFASCTLFPILYVKNEQTVIKSLQVKRLVFVRKMDWKFPTSLSHRPAWFLTIWRAKCVASRHSVTSWFAIDPSL